MNAYSSAIVAEALEAARLAAVAGLHRRAEQQLVRIGLARAQARDPFGGSQYCTWLSAEPVVTNIAG
jgi:hypothetical protein